MQGRGLATRKPRPEAGVASLYQHVPFRQDTSYLSVGERTNANGSKAFREAMLAEKWDDCIEIARDQTRDGAHLLDVSVDYVGRDGVRDMREVVSRFATASTLPLMLDSTEPALIEAGLELLGGRSIVNSVNYEDGVGPDSRFARVMPVIREHGAAVVALCIDEEGQARTAEWKVRVASRLIDDLTTNWGMHVEDIIVDTLTFPIATGQEETRRDGLETIEAIREIKRRYPDGADHAGPVQRVVRPEPRRPHRPQLRLPARVHQGRARLRDRARRQDPADDEDRGGAAQGRSRPGLRPPQRGLRPAGALPRPLRGRRRGSGAAVPLRGARRCSRWGSGSPAGSSTASATASRATCRRLSTPA